MKASTSKGASTGSSGGVLISWKTMKNEVCSPFKDLYHKREKDGDVTIVCSGQLIKAHKVVLSVGSLYFRDALESAPSKHPTILVKGISATTMNNLLCCLYFGEVIINPAFVKDLNSAAEELGMFTRDTQIKLREISDQPQVLKKPETKSPPKIGKQVDAATGQFPFVKMTDAQAFNEQRDAPKKRSRKESYFLCQETLPKSLEGKSFHYNEVGLTSGGKVLWDLEKNQTKELESKLSLMKFDTK